MSLPPLPKVHQRNSQPPPAERRLTLLEVFREVSQHLLARFDPADIAQVVLERLSTLLQADQAAVFYALTDGQIELIASLPDTVPPDATLAETVLRTGKAIQDGPFAGSGAAFAVPLEIGQRVTGAITATYQAPNPPAEDLETLLLFAPLLAAALERAQQRQRELEYVRDERLRTEVANAVAKLRSIPELCRAVVEAINQILGYELIAIFSLEPRAAHLELEAWSGVSEPYHRVSLQETLTGECVRQRQPKILDLDDPRFKQPPVPVSSMICVPLVGYERVLGCINVASYGNTFLRPADLALLQSIANPVAVAFENALLFATLEARSRDLERLSREAQMAAMLDPLTGLPNRRAFETDIRALAERPGTPFSLAVIDLVGFKAINDKLGHASGDTALVRIAGILREDLGGIFMADHMPEAHNLPSEGCAYRVGGDEFLLLLPNRADRAVLVVQELIGRIQALEIEGEGHSLRVGLNVGLAEYPVEVSTLDGLQSLADDRMYAAKRAQIPILERQLGRQQPNG